MPKGYDPRYVMKQVSNALLQDLFEGQMHTVDVPWDELKETQVEPIFEAWQAMEEESCLTVGLILHDVFEMANEVGVQAIFEVAKQHGHDDLLSELDGYVSVFDIAMWTCLRAASVWSEARQFAKADSVAGGRYWIRRANLPEANATINEDTIAELAAGMTAFYRRGQGRGRRCSVEYLRRANGKHYFFAYLDDYAHTYLKLVGDGEFARVCETHAFQVLFVYDEVARTLDMYVTGGKRTYMPLQEIFVRVILGAELPADDPQSEAYMLGMLLNPSFNFATDLEDGIDRIEIRSGIIAAKGVGRRSMELKPDWKVDPLDFYAMVDVWVNLKNVPRSIMELRRVEMRIVFDGSDPNMPSFIDFSVSTPNRSSIPNLKENERELVEKYLRQWGIDRVSTRQLAVSAA